MSKISIVTENNKLIFDTVYFLDDNINLNNTNVIDMETMFFSKVYVSNNMYTMTSFLNLIASKKGVRQVVIRSIEVAPLALSLCREMPVVEKVTIAEDVNLDYETFEALRKAENIKKLECFSMPPFMFDTLDQEHSKLIKLRQKEMFYSPFMKDNNLESYDQIYYAKKLMFNEKPGSSDLEDIASFFRINTKIRIIEFNYYDYNLVNNIISYLNRNNASNVLIKIKYVETENINSMISSLEKSYTRYFNNNNVKIKIVYKDENKTKFFLKQFNLNLFRASLALLIIIILALVAVFNYKEFMDARTTVAIERDMNREFFNIQNAINSEMNAQDAILAEEAGPPKVQRDESYDVYYEQLEKAWTNLKQKNSDTVAWLNVPGTKVNYPVVQSGDNIYYLNRNFYRNSNIYGWVFMDYRNKVDTLDQNTIIYGHRTSNGIMFGTLQGVLNKSWYTNPDNQYIYFDTETESNRWQIFSIYTVDVTNDYLYTNFNSDAQREEFFNKIKGRSIHDFEVSVDIHDKILTLSTCFEGSEKRLVIHAKREI